MSKRLELCWSGKYDRPRVEPRILIRDDARSHGAPSDNMLIHGDNLLALKSLLPKFAGCLNGISSGRFFRDHLAGRYVEDGYGVLYKVHGLGPAPRIASAVALARRLLLLPNRRFGRRVSESVVR